MTKRKLTPELEALGVTEEFAGCLNFPAFWRNKGELLDSLLTYREKLEIRGKVPNGVRYPVTEDQYKTIVAILGEPKLYGFEVWIK